MYKIINGREIAEKIKDDIAQEVFSLASRRPHLAIILAGDREDSRLYVSLKEKEGVKLGIDTSLYEFVEDSSEEEIIGAINFLNNDENVDAILVQLPLPNGINTDKVIMAVDPLKDADGFHVKHPDYVISPVLAAVAACIQEIPVSYRGSKACLLYNSEIFGRGLKEIIGAAGYSVIAREKINEADLVVSALGEAGSLKAENLKKGVIVIDIGISKKDGHVCGDADSESLKDCASYLTPVPGGIGPMTIAFLFKNVLAIYQHKNHER